MGRHWPEATRVLKLSSVTLLRALSVGAPRHWPRTRKRRMIGPLGPEGSSGEEDQATDGRCWFERGRSAQVAAASVRDYAQQAAAARAEGQREDRRLYDLAAENVVLQARGKVVGVPGVCVVDEHR